MTPTPALRFLSFVLFFLMNGHDSSARDMKVELQDHKQVDSYKATPVFRDEPYIVGYRNTPDSTQPYIAGYRTTPDSTEPYIVRYGTTPESTKPYIAGYRTTLDSIKPYLAGYKTITDSTKSYLAGYRTIPDSTKPYIVGYRTIPDSTKPYLAGYKTTPGSIKPYIAGYRTTPDSTKPYIAGYRTTPDSTEPYIAGYRTTPDSVQTYIAGYRTTSNSTKPYIAAYKAILHSTKPYLAGYRTTPDSTKPYIAGYRITPNSIKPYIVGYRTTTDSNAVQPSFNVDHTEAFKTGFFTLDDLYVGNIMTLQFPVQKFSHFLPRKEADSIPFSISQLASVLQLFSISEDSPLAKSMKGTLDQCEAEPITGETKVCVSSLESMLEFVGTIISSKVNYNILTTSYPTPSSVLLQNYTILEVSQDVNAPKWVACHPLPYPYAIYYCHFISTGSKVFKVLLDGENGDKVEALGVCHLDTFDWSPDHILFRQLGFKPGEAPVCHFFPVKHLMYVPQPSKATM